MPSFILYKGYADSYRWRERNDGDFSKKIVDGTQNTSALFATKEEALADLMSKYPDATVQDRTQPQEQEQVNG